MNWRNGPNSATRRPGAEHQLQGANTYASTGSSRCGRYTWRRHRREQLSQANFSQGAGPGSLNGPNDAIGNTDLDDPQTMHLGRSLLTGPPPPAPQRPRMTGRRSRRPR
jgi:hypothetical protein